MPEGGLQHRPRQARTPRQRRSTGRGRWAHVLAAAVAALLVAPQLLAAATATTAEDPRRSQLWWFEVLGIEEAWETSRGDGIVVAVIDTGVQLDHPDLVGQLAVAPDGSVGRDLVDGGAVTGDANGHGTLVAGLLAAAADNGVGAAGVAPGARILPVRVLDADGRGRASTVDAGIRWAVDNGADVVNLSLEVEETAGGPDATLVAPNAAIDYAWERGVVVVAAAGNSAAGAAAYPIGSPVVLVGATDPQDELATFSDVDRVDAVVAPGTDMVATWCLSVDGGCDPATPYGIGTGTSFAAPVASGVVALLLGLGLRPEQAVRMLRETAVDLGVPGPDGRFGTGRIDAAAAVAAGATLAAGPGSGPDPTPSRQPPPSPSAPVTPSGEAPLLDVPGSAAPAPPTDEPMAEGRREPVTPSPALALAVVVLLLATVVATARGTFSPRPPDG